MTIIAANQYHKQEKLLDELLGRQEVSKFLTTLQRFDPETYQHSIRVAKNCYDIARKTGLTHEETKILITGAALHDIGKLLMTDLVNKKTALTEEEHRIIKQHPYIGFGLLKEFPENKVKYIVKDHHKHKKMPYPYGGINPETMMLSEIVAACDMYDALTQKRAYKEAFSNSTAISLLEKEYTGNKDYIKLLV